MYSSATINGTVAATPSGVSLACLGCHDGTVAVNNLVNQPNLGSTGNPTFLTNASTALLDTDLRNDHPISITYNTADTGLRANANATVTNGGNTLQLFGTGPYTVECGSCHQVHDNTNVPFLRIPNTNSQLCLVCHDK
jgi:predicted CXXCH cytochrome family protein